MKVINISNYTIVQNAITKQIYSPTRMLQISKNFRYYVDTESMKLIRKERRK